MNSHRGRRALVAILKEAVEIEQVFFEPIVTKLTNSLEASALSSRQLRLAKKAARSAGAKVHFDHNARLLDSLPQVKDEELNESVRFRNHHIGKAILLLAATNSVVIGTCVVIALSGHKFTHSWWISGAIVAACLFSASGMIRRAVGIIVRGSIGSGPRKQLRRQIVTEEIGPPLGFTPGASERVGTRRFRRYIIRAFVLYLASSLIARLFTPGMDLAVLIPLPFAVVAVTYVEVQPLRRWYDGLVWSLLHCPKNEHDAQKWLP